MTDTSEADFIAVSRARSTARRAHHDAGHAVASFVAGGHLQDDYLGTVGLSGGYERFEDTPHCITHRKDWHSPFVTFAGPWAEARWMVEDPFEEDDFEVTLDYAWRGNVGGDTDKYEARISRLESTATQLGFSTRVGRLWEIDWNDELTDLWPAIQRLAMLLIVVRPITHDMVIETIRGCPPSEHGQIRTGTLRHLRGSCRARLKRLATIMDAGPAGAMQARQMDPMDERQLALKGWLKHVWRRTEKQMQVF